MSTKPPAQPFVLHAKQKIGELLIQGGILTQQQLDEALSLQKQKGGKVGRILIEKGYLNEQTLLIYLGKQCGIHYINLSDINDIPQATLETIPYATAKRQLVVPIKKEGRRLTVAMADPLNVFALDDIKLTTGLDVLPVLASTEEIQACLAKFYKQPQSIEDSVKDTEMAYRQALENVEDADNVEQELASSKPEIRLDEKTTEAPVIKLVNAILVKAIQMKASDIHFEPYEKSFRVRYRIDGVLHEQPYPPKSLQNSIVARLKILAGADIAEKRVPQDGRIKLKMAGSAIDVRASFLPTAHGEKVVLRILDSSGLRLDLKQLGFEPDNLARYERAIHSPYGMILITGPTGSGKSTTLYSSLYVLNHPERNIMTIEDPIEYIMPGINQVGVNAAAGLTFALGLRSFLRQDPDVIMVGEIRDLETAEIAANAALTGHLVFATLHTNDAPSAPARLMYLGVEPFLIASSLLIIVAQRLVRVNCPSCKESYTVQKKEVLKLNLPKKFLDGLPEQITLFKGRGCEQCSGTGYKGRIGIHEVMEVSDPIRDAITRKASTQEIQAIAVSQGMGSLRLSCFHKAMAGITSMEEMLRVTMEQ